jgi:hypothetical protein
MSFREGDLTSAYQAMQAAVETLMGPSQVMAEHAPEVMFPGTKDEFTVCTADHGGGWPCLPYLLAVELEHSRDALVEAHEQMADMVPKNWHGLMEILQEVYPEEVFPRGQDNLKADCLVRVVSLIRHLDEMRNLARDVAMDYGDECDHPDDCACSMGRLVRAAQAAR